MSEENGKTRKRADEVIELRHTYEQLEKSGVTSEKVSKSDLEAELESEKKRREEAELVIEVIANKDYEQKKLNLLKNIPEDRREKISNFIGDEPEKLAQIQAGLLLSGQDIEDYYDENVQPQKSPSGKAGMSPSMMSLNQQSQTRSPTYTNPTIQKFSDLYATLRDSTSSAESKAEAEQLLDDAFVEIGKGLRSRSRNNPYSLPNGVVSNCWRCGNVVEMDLGTGKPCPYCSHRFGIDKFPRNPKFQPR